MRVLHAGWGYQPFRGGGLIAYAEDVMRAQVRRGDQVGYFFAGRHVPGLRRTRLLRWSRSGVRMYEVLNSPIPIALGRGTAFPERELDEPQTERLFRQVLARFDPDVVHIQEIFGLPSSLIEVAREAGVPTVMTLQDYLPLCPTLKLYDADGRICLRHRPAEQCQRCSRNAPLDTRHLQRETTAQLLVALGRRFPATRDAARAAMQAVAARMPTRASTSPSASPAPEDPASRQQPSAAAYQRRRDTNLGRLSRVNRLLAMSPRVEEIYAGLGVARERLSTLRLTVDHLAGLSPRSFETPPNRPCFATLNGANSTEKGSQVVLEAVRKLDGEGLGGAYTLKVYGTVAVEVSDELARSSPVRLEGACGAPSLDRLLQDVDVGIVPSVWEEAYGYVGLEFLAKGIPVIGNAMGGIVDYTRPGQTGWVNETSDGAGLAALMAAVIRDPQQILDLHERIVERRPELIKPLHHHLSELDLAYGEASADARGSSPPARGAAPRGSPQ